MHAGRRGTPVPSLIRARPVGRDLRVHADVLLDSHEWMIRQKFAVRPKKESLPIDLFNPGYLLQKIALNESLTTNDRKNVEIVSKAKSKK